VADAVEFVPERHILPGAKLGYVLTARRVPANSLIFDVSIDIGFKDFKLVRHSQSICDGSLAVGAA